MEQTNRTILFEEINPEVENLLTFIDSENSESLPDSILRKIQNSLEVSSFDEFLNKMQPKIYLYMNSDTKNVSCTTQPNGTEMTALSSYEETQCIAFNRGNRLLEYYLGKISGSAKVYEVMDDDLKIAELIGPGYSKEEFYTAYSRFMSLLAENKVSEAKVEMRNFCHKYRNALVMLPMIIDYMQEVLYRLGNGKKVNQIMVQKDEGTQVKIEKVSAAFLRRSIKLNEYTINTYAEMVQEQLQSITNTALIKDFFQIAIWEYEKDDVALENMYEQYLMYYQKVMEQFWWDARPLLEKLLGVYTFFFHINWKKEK